MRLTLRTLLAYIDDILGPADSEDIVKKIRDSEYATSLLHRIREVMQRLRLEAPDVSDPGAGLDANTVAEYLDNILPDEQVPDFERVCLESDVQLAEVASAHQILALVLGEPAEVKVASRERMYRLVDEQDQAQRTSIPDLPDYAKGRQSERGRRQRPTVPDYLRDPPKTKRRIFIGVVGVAVAALLIVVLLAALGQFDPGAKFAAILGLDKPTMEQETPKGPVPPPREETDQVAAKAEPGSQPEGKPEIKTKSDAKTTTSESLDEVEKATKSGIQDSAAITEAGPIQPEPAIATPDQETPGVRTEDFKEGSATPAPVDSADSEADGAQVGKPDEVGDGTKSSPSLASSEQVGRFVSDSKVVLLQLDPASGDWARVPAQAILFPDRKLLALPTYQPLIASTAGVTVQLIGGTQVEFEPVDQAGIPGLQVDYGRIILRTVGKANARLRLILGSRAGLLTFGDPEVTVAIEVSRIANPGADPENNPGNVTASIFATSGRIVWKDDSDQKLTSINGPSVLRLDGHPRGSVVAVKDFPKWVFRDSMSLLERRASGKLEQSLEQGRSAILGLRELADHRQKEVRWLATRCLGYLGDFDLMASALNVPSKKLVWDDYISQLKIANSRSPESAKRIRLALQKEFGDELGNLARMLWGFAPEGLEKGDGSMLVDYLDHKVLAFRVLSHWNLKKITGLGLYYQPEVTSAKRQQSVQKWRERLESGQIWSVQATNSGGETIFPTPKKADKN